MRRNLQSVSVAAPGGDVLLFIRSVEVVRKIADHLAPSSMLRLIKARSAAVMNRPMVTTLADPNPFEEKIERCRSMNKPDLGQPHLSVITGT